MNHLKRNSTHRAQCRKNDSVTIRSAASWWECSHHSARRWRGTAHAFGSGHRHPLSLAVLITWNKDLLSSVILYPHPSEGLSLYRSPHTIQGSGVMSPALEPPSPSLQGWRDSSVNVLYLLCISSGGLILALLSWVLRWYDLCDLHGCKCHCKRGENCWRYGGR